MNAKDYNKLVTDHSDGVYRFILKQCRDEAEAQDIVQDCFEKLWLNKEKIDANKAKSYLFTAAYHTMIDHIRKTKRITALEDAHENNYSHTEGEYTGIKEMVDRALMHLPENQRAVVMLRDYEGYSYEDIAEITGLNTGQVRVYIHRARTFLKDYLKKIENYSHEHKRA